MANQFDRLPVYALFDATPTPLLTFGATGLVSYANPAAKTHPGRLVEAMNGNPIIKSLVTAIKLGRAKLPYSAKVEVADGQHIAGQFMRGPSGTDVAFLARSETVDEAAASSQQSGARLKNIMGLLRNELVPSVNSVLNELQLNSPDTGHAAADTPAGRLGTACQALNQRLARLLSLIEVFGEEVLSMHERIESERLVRSVVEELGERATKLKVALIIEDIAEGLAPIYGNQRMLRHALHECIENAIAHSRQSVDNDLPLAVKLSLKQTGAFLRITVVNHGVSKVRIDTDEPPRTFMESELISSLMLPRIGLSLMQSIIRLHGGRVRISSIDGDSTQVLMELPTGAPRNQGSMDQLQVRRYAADIAQIRRRRKKEKA